MKRNQKYSQKRRREIGFILCLIVLPIIHFIFFYIYINAESLLLAFRDDAGYTLKYFKMFFNQISVGGSELSVSLRNTLIFFAVNIGFTFPVSLIFSYLLYKKIYMYPYFRIVFFFPSIISAVVMVALYKNILNGPISDLWMKLFHTDVYPRLLDSTEHALASILFYGIWLGLAGNMVIYSGTMGKVSGEVIESAKIDGVGFWGELFYMVIPLIWPTISTLLLLSFINIFGASGPILLFTQGEYNTSTVAYWIFAKSTSSNPDYSYAAACGLVFTLIQLPIVAVVRKISNQIDKRVES